MTSIDTNIVISVLDPDDANHALARPLLEEVGQANALVISPVVYSELMASSARDLIRQFLRYAEIEVLWETPPELWQRARRSVRRTTPECGERASCHGAPWPTS